MASDLKSDLVMTAIQRRPTVHLMGNPAVVPSSQTLLRCLGPMEIDFLVSSGSQADLRDLDDIVLACTSGNLVRARFSSKKVFNKLDLRS